MFGTLIKAIALNQIGQKRSSRLRQNYLTAYRFKQYILNLKALIIVEKTIKMGVMDFSIKK